MTQPTIDEIRDQIAEWEGREIPYTLDEAAKLPEGWLCWISNPPTNCEGWWIASARHASHDVGDNITESAPTEIEARFRLRHAAMKAERGIA